MAQFEIKYGGELPKQPAIRLACFFTIKHGEKIFSYEVYLGRLLSATWGNVKEEEARLFLIELGLKEAREQLAKGNEQNGYKIKLAHCPRPRLSNERRGEILDFLRCEPITLTL
ncbi:MAG TPA: hypothetical protein ACFYED_05715 [Candidatus Tripitaka californicus]|uniref:hypothetical protein n=1 Tax=Candidatus Tripitaka californicus TaxID=3367616 RepID=UPI004025056B